MKRQIDMEALLSPISDENPSGVDLRYTGVYEQIKEARRFDDPLDQGEWKTGLKTADWEKVISLAVAALSEQTKDIQIAAWLTEALTITEGFEGLRQGLAVMNGLLETFWESLYPQIEEGDLEYRIAPLEFMNEKLWTIIKQVPVTDPGRTSGYSWLKWQESRDVGYEADSRNKYGDVDEGKKTKRDQKIQEGRLTAEEFDSAVAASTPASYAFLAEGLAASMEAFAKLDGLVDEKFGSEAPRLAELGKAIEDCGQLVQRMLKEKGGAAGAERRPAEPVPRPAPAVVRPDEIAPEGESEPEEVELPETSVHPRPAARPAVSGAAPNPLQDASGWEQQLWETATRTMQAGGFTKALESLLEASLVAPSIRERNRCKLLLGKLCLNAERPDLARPILEQLHVVVEQLQLEQWESPVWIADVIGSLYQCLTSGEPSDDDYSRAQILFQKLCTIDITKAMAYRKQ
jgi:type VI secretion system protein ImpA